MSASPVEPLRKGDLLKHDWLNRVADSARPTEAGYPLETVSVPGGGTLVRLATIEPIWAQITSGTHPYAWTEKIPMPGGTWLDGFLSGTTSTNPAYEVNAVTTVTAQGPVYVPLRFCPTANEWRFQADECSGQSQQATGITQILASPIMGGRLI